MSSYCKLVTNNNGFADLRSVLESMNNRKISDFNSKGCPVTIFSVKEVKSEENFQISEIVKSLSPLSNIFEDVKIEKLEIKSEMNDSLRYVLG